MKNTKINGIILFVVTAAILIYVLKDNFTQTINIISSANLLWILIATTLYVIAFSVETMVLRKLIKQYKKDYSLLSTFKLTIMTKFFNGITPFSAGGRPLQLIEFKKRDIKISDGTNIVVQQFIVFEISFIILAGISFILDYIFNFFSYVPILDKLTKIGFLINIAILGIAFLLSLSKKLNKKIVKAIVLLLSGLKIVKNKEEQLEKWEATCNEYYDGFNSFRNNRQTVWKCILLELIALMIEYMIPLCIFKSLGPTINLNIISCLVASVFVYMSGCYIPIPGGTGGMEYGFMNYFANFTGVFLISPALILWRFITYYLPTLIGGIAFNINKKKNEKMIL